jgi:hypothetical protein
LQALKVLTRAADRDFGSIAVANVMPRFPTDPAEFGR